MEFIDSYKHLEKLCGEILNDDRRVSAYIDEMRNTPQGALYVSSWDEDLKKLKRYRWVRNQIAHEPGCNERNMCEPEDALWLDSFYSRIMNQTDPLSLYRKAAPTPPQTMQNYKQSNTIPYIKESPDYSKTSRKPAVWTAFLIVVLLFAVMIAFAFVAAIIFSKYYPLF